MVHERLLLVSFLLATSSFSTIHFLFIRDWAFNLLWFEFYGSVTRFIVCIGTELEIIIGISFALANTFGVSVKALCRRKIVANGNRSTDHDHNDDDDDGDGDDRGDGGETSGKGDFSSKRRICDRVISNWWPTKWKWIWCWCLPLTDSNIVSRYWLRWPPYGSGHLKCLLHHVNNNKIQFCESAECAHS